MSSPGPPYEQFFRTSGVDSPGPGTPYQGNPVSYHSIVQLLEQANNIC